MVAEGSPLHTIDLDKFSARQPRRRFWAREVFVEFHIDNLVSDLPFVLLEDERARTGEIRNLRIRIGLGNALRHHKRYVRRALAKRSKDQSCWLFQFEPERLGIDDFQVLYKAHEHLACCIFGSPALDRGNAII